MNEDKMLVRIHDTALLVFAALMIICVCIASVKDRSQQNTIRDLENKITVMEDQNNHIVSELNSEINSLNVLLDTTKKQYEDRISQLESEIEEYRKNELKYYSDESLYRGYKLTDDVYVN